MQKLTSFIFCFFLFNFYSNLIFTTSEKSPLLVVTIMIKNEAKVIEATLEPFLKAGVQHYLVLDTGSTDNTVKIVQNLFKKYKIQHGHIMQEPFVNFAVSRNFALESAEKIFPDAIFLFMIDAEWYMHNVPGLLEFCEKYKNNPSKAFLIKRVFLGHKMIDYGSFLFKAHQNVRYFGAVHETINQIGDIKIPDDVYLVINPSKEGGANSARRWHRDLDILLKEHEKNPNNLRTIFYLGQTNACLKNYDQALFWYGKRCKKNTHDEENYKAHYRMGLIYEQLNNWPQALKFYFKAYNIRPQRIDSLILIAQHFLNIQAYQAAFLLANYITTLPVSDQERFASLPEMHDFTLYDILAQAAWRVGEYEIGRKAVLKTLDYDSSRTTLRNNLKLYEDALNHLECSFLNRNFWCKWCNATFWLSRPTWFNYACLSHGCLKSNRCNFSQGVTWRYWVGPFYA